MKEGYVDDLDERGEIKMAPQQPRYDSDMHWRFGNDCSCTFLKHGYNYGDDVPNEFSDWTCEQCQLFARVYSGKD